MKKIEIITWFKCNCQCVFCASHMMTTGEALTAEDIARILKTYKARGIDMVDFGGGEPTARPDLPAMIAAARHLGYRSIGLKTNGMRLCYPEYLEALMVAGVNNFCVSVWGHDPDTHDRLAGRSGAFEMTEMAIKHLVDYNADVCVDFLITTETLNHLEQAIGHWINIGVSNFTLWLFSVFGSGRNDSRLLPVMSAAGNAAAAAIGALKDSIDSIKTSHITPCLLKNCWNIYYNIKDLELYVVSKNGGFWAEQSPFEAGIKLPACGICKMNAVCAGPRPEYVKQHGAKEFSPLR
jgi:MoaA/NifB/PqqE/SkfB family radical SAM enzyme